MIVNWSILFKQELSNISNISRELLSSPRKILALEHAVNERELAELSPHIF